MFARHYLRNHFLFSSPTGTKMFQFPAFASIIRWIISLQDIGLSHSEIFGLKAICTYPKLIAAYHVLHRLREPRHPPCALAYFLPYYTILFVYTFSIAIWFDIYFKAFFITENYFFICFCTLCQRSFSSLSLIVENNGFEPLTPCVQGRCSSQLS